MKEFLRQVAEHWLAEGNIDRRCFIFPNRRSAAFFRKYLGEAVMERGRGPQISPVVTTVNDFVHTAAGLRPTGRVSLLLELYRCYTSLLPKGGTLDEFIFWGDVLLSDFDDVDKYLADPKQIFTNVSDFKNVQDTFEYLTEGQRKAVEHFLSHFRQSAGLKQGLPPGGVKEKFLQVWDILLPLYLEFNSSISRKGMSYEGKVYREMATMMKEGSAVDVLSSGFPLTDHFVFVGLNALNECEKLIMRRMRDAGIASFCWDWSDGWISNPHNKSTLFMKENLESFPQAFELEDGEGHALEINVLSVPSAVGQAKQLPRIFEMLTASDKCGDRCKLGIETAVILPDETLLVPVLNSIPPNVGDINVTMGRSMGTSALYSLMSDVASLQMHMRCKDGEWYFYHKQVYSIFSNSLFKSAAGKGAGSAISSIKSASQYYIHESSFAGDSVMEAVFRPVVKDPKSTDAGLISDLGDYLMEIIKTVAAEIKEHSDLTAELEFAKEYFQSVKRLKSEELPILPLTYFRLLSQLLGQCSVPFAGEPLKGLQIMGPLETRALDFRNIIIMSANEGVFPRRSAGSSFIPPELRKGFGLPTYEFQDAVWAYYFYRMIMRARSVWMVCDSRTEGLKSGEESRYIKQLEMHFKARVNRYLAKAPISVGEEDGAIEKSRTDIDTIKATNLSVTALQNYISCPVKFYFHTVKGLEPEAEVTESLDAGMIGNVFHNTMWALYHGGEAMNPKTVIDRKYTQEKGRGLLYVSREYLKEWLDRPDDIKARIRSLIMAELHSFEVSGRNLVFENVVFEYVVKVLERDLECMEDYGTMSFEIKGLEMKRLFDFNGFHFVGYLDRVDSFDKSEIRVVDYKTGQVKDEDINISDENAEKVVEKLFSENVKNSDRPKIALQLFMYDLFVGDLAVNGESIVNSIYSPPRLFVSKVEKVVQSSLFMERMKDRLSSLLEEISDENIPFRRTEDISTCEYCDFKTICGR